MTTLKITVDNRKNAQLLTKLLKSMVFVKKVEEDSPVTERNDQFPMNKKILDINPILKSDYKNKILDVSVWADSDLKVFDENQKLFDSWKVQKW